jgi:hypothetical protein
MEFAMTQIDAGTAEDADLLRAMLQHFRRIHAAKHGFRRRDGRRFLTILQVDSMA